jgi:hypothetical protein
VESRPSINEVSSSRVRCEAGSPVAMGCSFAGLAKARLLILIRKGCTPPNSGAEPNDLWDELPECSGSTHHLIVSLVAR